MKNIVVFNTSYGSQNMGDFIINSAFREELEFILGKNFVVQYGTHNPTAHFYQLLTNNAITRFSMAADYKFVSGTNFIKTNMFHPWPDWNVNIFNSKMYKGTILVGCGMADSGRTNLYTKNLYKKILSSKFIHSVRDERTKVFLEQLGFQAINTGCPTLWKLTEDFCKQIPTKKSDEVVFTLTDYCKDFIRDQELIDILNRNYHKVYFWIQGSNDYEYLRTFQHIENIEIISPNLESFSKFLDEHNVDYVGTRLHAGIFAMRKSKRSVIISVDHRTEDMKKTYHLNSVRRDNISSLEKYLQSSISTKVKIDIKRINEWKNQFLIGSDENEI